jgi:3-oxoacyl-[acyl-carrier-protein] synthase II
MGAVTPIGQTVDSFWDHLLACQSGVSTVTLFDPSPFEVTFGGEVSDFEPTVIDRKQIKRLDRFAQFAMVAADEAVRQAGVKLPVENPDRMGVIIGSGIGGLSELEEQHVRLFEKGPGKVSAFTIPKLMVNAASGNLSIRYGACGPSTAVATACASATNAMGDALHLIRRGDCDLVITGGSEAALTPLGLAAFAAMKALSTRNEDPSHASRPFDRDRDGFVLGEGAGILIFEEYEHARRRGARIFAEVCGFGTTADASHITQPSEDGIGAAKAMKRALDDAALSPESIDYINAHGTSTPLGDIAETVAIKRVFGQHAHRIPVSSTKSSIGHLLGASGGVEAIATVLAIANSVAPATINLEHPGEGCDLDYVPNAPRDCRIRRAMSNSFGFGGHNACIVFQRAD